MTDELQPGEVVRLKSGGPKMTVNSGKIAMKGGYRCTWFDGTELKGDYFKAEALVRVVEESENGTD